MRRPPIIRSLLVSACVSVLLCTVTSGQSVSTSNADLALVGGRIYVGPTDPPIADGIVLIHDGIIAAVGPRERVRVPRTAQSLDCTGLTIHSVPGRSCFGRPAGRKVKGGRLKALAEDLIRCCR